MNRTMDIKINDTVKALAKAGHKVPEGIKTHPLCIQRRILEDRCKVEGIKPIYRDTLDNFFHS